VLHQIGIGTLGPVFRTYEPTRDRLIAVKVFRLDIVPEQAQALADALGHATQASLSHPSIVEPIAAGVEGTVAYRAEEYVAAESLDVAMRHYAPAPIEKVLPFITQLAGGIDRARAAGVGHGGLHPRDIFVTPDEARATGFGVVEALEHVGIRAPVRRPYSAPERIEGGAWSTPADVFSLAAITFELLTGRRPAGTGAQIGALPPRGHSEALHAVLARAMADDPSKRYSGALAFAGALEAAGRGEGAAVPAPAVPVPAVPVPAVPAVPPVPPQAAIRLAKTPADVEIERELEPVPVHQTLDDEATEPMLFDAAEVDQLHEAPAFAPEPERDRADVAGEARSDRGGGDERFSDDFADEPAPETASAIGMAGYESPPENLHDDTREATRPGVLPVAIGLVIGLLIGFAGAYFLLSRNRPVSEATAAANVPLAQPAPAGPATREKPGQYSEQKVSPPSPSPAAAEPSAGSAPRPKRAEPPPVVAETAPPARGGASSTGRLIVRSVPSRAGVTVNGKWRGRTPLVLDELPFGNYVVRVVQPGYRVAHDEFTLGRRSAVHTYAARLERNAMLAAPSPSPAPARERAGLTGSLYVDSNPRGATVLLDGRSVGQTPLRLSDVSVGSHIIRLELAGKREWTSPARVIAGETARVTGSLEDK
jgi:Protein kinase domain/PEGA domain